MYKCAAFFDQFFSWSFWSSSKLPRLVVLRFCIVLRCVALMLCCAFLLCCDVMWCLLLVTLLCWLKISEFSCSFVARVDATTRRTYNRPAWPTWWLSKQNFHCVFYTGKHRFLRGIFVITTFYVPSVALVKLAKISSLSLTSAFWWPFPMLKRIANLKGAP